MAESAAKHLIPAILELGGKDASLVFADCHLDRAIEGITYGAFCNSGRVCVGIKRVYVEMSIYQEFLLRLQQRIASLRVTLEPDADLCPVSSHEAGLLRAQVADALARGARMHVSHDRTTIGYGPVLLTDVPPDARILTEDCFGPVLCMAPFSTEADAIALANDSLFALSASVWTSDRARASRVAALVSTGSCAINDVIRVVANPQAPFGGNRLSGYGRYHGPEGLRGFSRIKTIMFAGDRRKREINWFPFTGCTRRQLVSLLRFRHGKDGFFARLHRMLLPVLLGLAFCLPISLESEPQSHLTITVRLDQRAHGELGYLVFDSASGFPADRQKAIRHGFLPISPGALQLHVDTDLPPGIYAVSVYEDLNGNHKLDRNFLGIPREPVGVSNHAPARMGPPHFGECSFRLGSAAQTIIITLVRTS